MSIRIVNLTETASLQSGDFVAIDNESQGTHKFDATKLGDIMGANIATVYSSASSYTVGQLCMYNGNLYKCNTSIGSGETWNPAHWTQVTVGVVLYDKVDKVSGKGLSTNDFTNALKTKLDGIESGAEVNVQANWNEGDSSKDDYIKNKPTNATQSSSGFMSAADKTKLDGIATGAEVNVQANWNETNTGSDAYIQNKPTNATQSTAGFMSAADKLKLDGIASGAEVNVQANWNETNTNSDAYIQNKPVANTGLNVAGAFADAKAVGDAINALITDIKAGTEETADYHLGFYLDSNGDLWQVDND
jgi:hypothetical protein